MLKVYSPNNTKTLWKKNTYPLLLLVTGLFFSSATYATETIFSGSSDVEDTYLRGANTAITAPNNYGASTNLLLGSQNTDVEINTLMRFNNLETELAGQTVTNATLRLYLTNHASQTADLTIDIYEIAAANGNWVEGTSSGSVETGAPSWRFLAHNTVEWAGGKNGASVAGTDYVNSSIGTTTFLDNTYGYYDITIATSTIQKWIDTPSQNYGIILKPSSGYIVGEFAVLSSTQGDNVPQLVISSVPEPAISALILGFAALVLITGFRNRSR